MAVPYFIFLNGTIYLGNASGYSDHMKENKILCFLVKMPCPLCSFAAKTIKH